MPRLTEIEYKLIKFAAGGLSATEIALKLSLQRSYCSNKITRAAKKLGYTKLKYLRIDYLKDRDKTLWKIETAKPMDDEITETELDVIAHAASGLTNQEIGNKLYIETHTVGSHLSHAMLKLGLTNRVQLARWYYQRLEAS